MTTPLTKSALRRLLGIGKKTLEAWLATDPNFPRPTLESPDGSPAWNESTVKRYRGSLVDATAFAKILGISQATLQARRRNDPNFPQPVYANAFRMTPLWRRSDAKTYATTRRLPPLKTNPAGPAAALTFAQFADLMGISAPGLHAQKQTDPAFPPPITTGRGALWARTDVEAYCAYRADGGDAPKWKRHGDRDLDLVTLAEFAEIVGVTAASLKVYKANREQGFPAPALDSRYPVWRRADAKAFAQRRRAAKRK